MTIILQITEWSPLKCVAVQYLCRLKLNNNLTSVLLPSKELICTTGRRLNRLTPFLCSSFLVDVVPLSFEIDGYAGLYVSQII